MRSQRASASRTSMSARACAALHDESFSRMSSTCSCARRSLICASSSARCDHLVAALQDVLGLADLVRQRGAHLVDQVQQAPPVDDDAGADRHAPALGDHLFEPVDQV